MEREKASLLTNLQESQTQLQHTQGALTEQHMRVHRLTERVNTMKRLHSDKEFDTEETEKGDGPFNSCCDTDGIELLECKYRVAVTEVIDLKAELKALKEKYNQYVESQSEECNRSDGKVQALEAQVKHLEKSFREGRERISNLETELRSASGIASESNGMLNAAQDELVTFSEELAQLYHHVCLCNNETPNRVMLDYYRQSRVTRAGNLKGTDDLRALLSPRLARRLAKVTSDMSKSPQESPSKEPLGDGSKGEAASQSPNKTPFGSPVNSLFSASLMLETGDLRKEPMNIYNLNAIIRDQIKHLQKAVDRSLQLSKQRAAAQELAPILDKDKEACMEEILKFKSLLSTKREQITTLRLLLKANKQVQ